MWTSGKDNRKRLFYFEVFPDLGGKVISKTKYDLCCLIPEVRVQHSLIVKFSIDLKESFVGERMWNSVHSEFCSFLIRKSLGWLTLCILLKYWFIIYRVNVLFNIKEMIQTFSSKVLSDYWTGIIISVLLVSKWSSAG